MSRCLCCGKELRTETAHGWHTACVKAFFGTTKFPDIDVSKEVLNQIAIDNTSKGFTVPGVQKKLSLHLSREDTPRLTLVNYPTGYILKPQTEEYAAVFQLADSLELLSGEANDGVFSNGELYHILSKVLDRFFPKKAVPVRAEMCIPDSLSLTADSYENAARQIRAALQFLPATISVQFTENCPQEDIDAFRLHFDWLYGDREIPIIGALDFSFVTPCFLTSYSDGRFTLWISHYADAYQGRADTLDWLRVYDYTEYFNRNRPQAHK